MHVYEDTLQKRNRSKLLRTDRQSDRDRQNIRQLVTVVTNFHPDISIIQVHSAFTNTFLFLTQFPVAVRSSMLCPLWLAAYLILSPQHLCSCLGMNSFQINEFLTALCPTQKDLTFEESIAFIIKNKIKELNINQASISCFSSEGREHLLQGTKELSLPLIKPDNRERLKLSRIAFDGRGKGKGWIYSELNQKLKFNGITLCYTRIYVTLRFMVTFLPFHSRLVSSNASRQGQIYLSYPNPILQIGRPSEYCRKWH